VAVIDTASLAVVARISTEPGPVQVTVTPDQAFAWVAGDGKGTVQKISLATNTIVKTIRIAPDAGSHGISYGAGGKLLFVTNTGNSTVTVIDTTRDEIMKTVPVARAPEGIAFLKP
jgi:YVTN family beta-propeller protein